MRRARRISSGWPALTMPALLLRAARPLVPGGPYLVTDDDVAAFRRGVPGSAVVEIDANHYGIVAVPATADAAARFLGHRTGSLSIRQ